MNRRNWRLPFSAVEHNAGLRPTMKKRTSYGASQILKRSVEIAQFYGEIDEYDTICCIEPYHTKKEQSLSHVLEKTRMAEDGMLTRCCGVEKLVKKTAFIPLDSPKNHRTGYDKVILRDCAKLLCDKYACFHSMKQHIKLDKGKLIFIERMPLWYPKENNTLEKENQVTVGLRETMEALLRAGYSVSWDVS